MSCLAGLRFAHRWLPLCSSLARRLYPLLAGATNYYVHWLNLSSTDGLYHLPPTFSPEYRTKTPGDGDTSYELAICRWGLRAVLDLGSELGIDDQRAPLWRSRLARLANFSTDSRGLSVARGLPFSHPHRHFSHLMGIVLKDPTLMDKRQLLTHSIDNWRSLRVRDPHNLPGVVTHVSSWR